MYRERVLQPDGTLVIVRRSRKLAPLGECATKSEARRLAEELLARTDSSFADPRGTMTITQFAEKASVHRARQTAKYGQGVSPNLERISRAARQQIPGA